MDARNAAFFVGEGLSAFLEGVDAGKYPKPVMVKSRKRWRTRDLLAAIDSQDAPDHPSRPETDEEWLGRLDDAHAHTGH
jgi:hypothetical protein